MGRKGCDRRAEEKLWGEKMEEKGLKMAEM
jgi:hypothetical protein